MLHKYSYPYKKKHSESIWNMVTDSASVPNVDSFYK